MTDGVEIPVDIVDDSSTSVIDLDTSNPAPALHQTTLDHFICAPAPFPAYKPCQTVQQKPTQSPRRGKWKEYNLRAPVFAADTDAGVHFVLIEPWEAETDSRAASAMRRIMHTYRFSYRTIGYAVWKVLERRGVHLKANPYHVLHAHLGKPGEAGAPWTCRSAGKRVFGVVRGMVRWYANVVNPMTAADVFNGISSI